MKSRIAKIGLLLFVVSGVVAWNTTNSEDLLMGASNTTASPVGQLGVIGNSNDVKGRSLFVIGDSNQTDPAIGNDEWKWSLVVGTGNILRRGINNGGRGRNIISGDLNDVDATNCLISGYGNKLTHGASGIVCYQSAAIGQSNHIMAARAWAIGSWNEHSADYTATLGVDLQANVAKTVALGRYNEPMQTNDVVVIGAGASDTERQTALRITDDGGVILGRAQGDISMGDYQ